MNTKSKPIRGVPLNLKKLLSYQKKAVISREIVKNPSGTITLFAFDQGEGLSEHTAPFDAIVLVLEGAVKIFINGTPHIVKENQMIIMPAHQPHSLKAIKPFKMLLTLIKA